MNTVTGRRGALLAVLYLAGCASGAPDRQMADRHADAGAICSDTMGLKAANVPYDLCVQSLLQNLTALKQPSLSAEPIAMVELPESGTQKSCARFGLAPGSSAFETCADNLDASLFEAADAGAR